MRKARDISDLLQRLRQRDTEVKDFNKLAEQDKNKLQQEIQADHQRVLMQEAMNRGEIKSWWNRQRLKIEAQAEQVMNEDKLAYQRMTKPLIPKPTVVKNSILAFLIGGGICVLGQMILNTALAFGLGFKEAAAVSATSIVFGGALLTGLGIYDELGRYAGAGSIVPISGFANSIVSSALEYKREGFVYGIGAHIFTIAGPVLAYGIFVSIFVGLLYYFIF